ncbi:MAG: ISNCY family transposase, partial [Acidiferrobacter thiooxydans]
MSFGATISAIKEVFEGLPDQRKGKNGVYAMEDAALAAFSVFYTQSPSFLAQQI